MVVLLDALGTLVELQPPAPRLRARLAESGFDVSEERAAFWGMTDLTVTQVAEIYAHMDTLDTHLDALRRRLLDVARHLHGAKILTERLYGVGPLTALAMCCWLGGAGRFSSSRQAVRFTGLDITVYSCDGKRSPGPLSRQGPPVLRWCVYEAGKTHARTSATDHAYYATVKDRFDGNRAALAEARNLLRRAYHLLDELGDAAFTTA